MGRGDRCRVATNSGWDARRATVEPKGKDQLGDDDALERKVAALEDKFDPVPSSVVDAARAAFSARARAERAHPTSRARPKISARNDPVPRRGYSVSQFD